MRIAAFAAALLLAACLAAPATAQTMEPTIYSGGASCPGGSDSHVVCTADNTSVGRDGLDCCDKSLMTLGGLGKECTPFLVAR